MAGINITPLRKRFNSEIKKNFNLIKVVNNLKPSLQQKYIFLIVELSFLRIYVAWEQFLEDTFIKYMMGGKTSSGYKAIPYAHPKSLVHAQQFVNEGKEYSNWAPSETIRKASCFFKNGKPYKQALQPISQHFKEMRDIRNKIVHASRHSNEIFKSLVRSKISYAPRGITPGKFLLEIESQTGKTFFEFYIDYLVYASKKIVP